MSWATGREQLFNNSPRSWDRPPTSDTAESNLRKISY